MNADYWTDCFSCLRFLCRIDWKKDGAFFEVTENGKLALMLTIALRLIAEKNQSDRSVYQGQGLENWC